MSRVLWDGGDIKENPAGGSTRQERRQEAASVSYGLPYMDTRDLHIHVMVTKQYEQSLSASVESSYCIETLQE
jgi:hypothetical protein